MFRPTLLPVWVPVRRATRGELLSRPPHQIVRGRQKKRKGLGIATVQSNRLRRLRVINLYPLIFFALAVRGTTPWDSFFVFVFFFSFFQAPTFGDCTGTSMHPLTTHVSPWPTTGAHHPVRAHRWYDTVRTPRCPGSRPRLASRRSLFFLSSRPPTRIPPFTGAGRCESCRVAARASIHTSVTHARTCSPRHEKPLYLQGEARRPHHSLTHQR